VVAGRMGIVGDALLSLAADMADELANAHQPAAAAALLLQYLGDVDNGVAALARAQCVPARWGVPAGIAA
jgi:hypothetical protein